MQRNASQWMPYDTCTHRLQSAVHIRQNISDRILHMAIIVNPFNQLQKLLSMNHEDGNNLASATKQRQSQSHFL